MRNSRIVAVLTAGVLAIGGLVALAGPAGAVSGRAAAAVHDDFDGDGVPDVAIGSEGARVIRVHYSSATVEHSHTAYLRIPGVRHFIPYLSLTPGDYNGDGVDDLAVADSQYHNRGAVFVYLGSEGGLDKQPATTLEGPHPGSDTHWEFGRSLAAGDVDGDGYDDLAVDQVNITDQDPETVSGMVHVYRGSSAGLSKVDPLPVRHGMPAPAAIADIDGDGHPDLIAGTDDGYARGVLVFAGTSNGFAARPTAVRMGPLHLGNPLAFPLAVGDVNGDGYPDVFAGDATAKHGGAIVVLFGGPDGLSVKRSQVVFEKQVYSPAGQDDGFGYSVGIGHISGHHYPDVIVGALDQAAGGVRAAGAVLLLHGSAHGLSVAHPKRFTLATPGVPGRPSQGDQFGQALSVADFTGDGHDDMVVGAPHKAAHGRKLAGFVTGLRGSASGPTTKPFSTVTGTRRHHQTLGIVIS